MRIALPRTQKERANFLKPLAWGQHLDGLGVSEMATGFSSSALLPFLGEGSPIKIDYRKKDILILTSLLEDIG